MVVLDIQQEVRECGNLRRPRRYGYIKQKVFVSVNDGGILMPKVNGKLLSNHHALLKTVSAGLKPKQKT